MQVRSTSTGFKGLLGFFYFLCCCSRVAPHLYAISGQIKSAKVNMHFNYQSSEFSQKRMFLQISGSRTDNQLWGLSQGKHAVQLTTSPSAVNSCSTVWTVCWVSWQISPAMKKKRLP